MPAWNGWWHLGLHTHGSWLHGDPRGFRSRKHRLHSSGDYKKPPPPGEHAPLHTHQQQHASCGVVLSPACAQAVGEALRKKLTNLHRETLVIAVAPTHAHLLCRVEGIRRDAQTLEARLKQVSSHAVRSALPGRVWARGGKPIEINDRGHQLAVYRYILRHAREGAWVWDFKRGVIHDPAMPPG